MADSLPLAAALATAYPEKTATLLEAFPDEDCAALLADLDAVAAASVVAEMAPLRAAACVVFMRPEAALGALRLMSPRDAAAILRNISKEKRDVLVADMPRARQLQLGILLRQPLQTVGAWMDSEVFSVSLETTAGVVRNRLARASLAPARLYVTDTERRLIGWIAVPSVLAAAGDDAPMSALYTAGGPVLRASMGLDVAAADPGWRDHDELPVVDRRGIHVGAIRYAALRRAMAQAADASPAPDSGGTGTIMDIANLCYLGMARAVETSIARRRFDTPSRKENAS